MLVWDASPRGIDGVHAVLDGAWLAIRPVATAAMIDRGGGLIVLLAPRPGSAAAEAARAGLENLARTLSVEWARFGVRPVAVLPGDATSPAEVAELVAFLAPAGGCVLLGVCVHARRCGGGGVARGVTSTALGGGSGWCEALTVSAPVRPSVETSGAKPSVTDASAPVDLAGGAYWTETVAPPASPTPYPAAVHAATGSATAGIERAGAGAVPRPAARGISSAISAPAASTAAPTHTALTIPSV